MKIETPSRGGGVPNEFLEQRRNRRAVGTEAEGRRSGLLRQRMSTSKRPDTGSSSSNHRRSSYSQSRSAKPGTPMTSAMFRRQPGLMMCQTFPVAGRLASARQDETIRAGRSTRCRRGSAVAFNAMRPRAGPFVVKAGQRKRSGARPAPILVRRLRAGVEVQRSELVEQST